MKINSYTREILIMLIATLFAGSGAYAEGKPESGYAHKVFTTAPAPEEIADILFPRKYRGSHTTALQETPAPLFSMMINFEFDSDRILPQSIPLLQALGEMMGIDSVANRAIVVEGHTDAIGPRVYNQYLSEKRARAIKSYLVEEYGIAEQRLIAVGKGERVLYLRSKPNAPMNRRATFKPAKNIP